MADNLMHGSLEHDRVGALHHAEPLPTRLSSDLRNLLASLDGTSLTVGQLEQALKGRGFAMLTMLMALPFCIIPIPGLSVPFGSAILLMGLRLAIGRKPWLPKFVLNHEISHVRLEKLLHAGVTIATRMEKIVKPRMHFLQRWPGMMNLIGVGIVSAGVLFILPMPFSNWVPAWAVLFLTAGMMERDGLLVLIGHILTILSWALVIVASVLGVKGIEKLFSFF